MTKPSPWKIAQTLLAGAAMWAGAASQSHAIDKIKFSAGGDFHLTGAFLEQETRDVALGGWPAQGLDEFGAAFEGTAFLKAKMTLENGLEIGARISLDANISGLEETASSAGGFGPVSPTFDYDDSLFFNEGYVYVNSAFGQAMLGKVRGAASLLNLGTPHISGTNRIDLARTYLVEDPGTPEHVFHPNGLTLQSDLRASATSLKLVYLSPRLLGLQLGLSYAPESEENYAGILTGFTGAPGQQENIWEVAFSYLMTLSDLDLGVYAAYAAGTLEDLPAPLAAFQTDLEEWGGGVALKFEGLTLGANYKDTNVAGGSSLSAIFKQPVGIVLKDRRTEIWSVGASYETGPWKFGVEYAQGEEELFVTGHKQEGKGLQIAASYTIAEGLNLTAGYQNWAYSAGGTLPVITPNSPSAVAFTPNTADADVYFVGVSYNVTVSDLFK